VFISELKKNPPTQGAGGVREKSKAHSSTFLLHEGQGFAKLAAW
jgi:hypothetical protein